MFDRIAKTVAEERGPFHEEKVILSDSGYFDVRGFVCRVETPGSLTFTSLGGDEATIDNLQPGDIIQMLGTPIYLRAISPASTVTEVTLGVVVDTEQHQTTVGELIDLLSKHNRNLPVLAEECCHGLADITRVTAELAVDRGGSYAEYDDGEAAYWRRKGLTPRPVVVISRYAE